MKAELVAFGQLKIEGERYNRDVVIEGGKIRKRDKALRRRSRAGLGTLRSLPPSRSHGAASV